MSGPITWRTVLGPSLADASAPLTAAQRSFSGAFDTLNQALAQRQQANQIVQNRQEEGAKQGYLNDLFAADAPEALLQQRQTFLDRLQGLTPEAQAAVRGQFDQRVDALRTQALKANEYTEATEARKYSPEVNRIQAEIARGNEEGVAGAIDALPAKFRAALFKDADVRGQTELQRSRDATRFSWDEETQKWVTGTERPLAEKAKKAQIAASNSSVAESGLRQTLTKRQIEQLNESDAVATIVANARNLARGNEITDGLPTPRLVENMIDKLTAGEGVSAKVRAAALDAGRKVDTDVSTAFADRSKAEGLIGPESIQGGAGATKALLETLKELQANKTLDADDAELIRNNLTELINDGYTYRKGTVLPDGTQLKEDLKVYPTGNVIRQAVPSAQGLLGWNWGIGRNAKSQAEELMKSPEFIRQYAERMSLDERARFLSALPKPDDNSRTRGPVKPSQLRYGDLK